VVERKRERGNKKGGQEGWIVRGGEEVGKGQRDQLFARGEKEE